MKNSLKEQVLRLGSLLLPGLAGLLPTIGGASETAVTNKSNPTSPDDNRLVLKQALNFDSDNMYAGHTSHRSHSSHTSHRSGSGGYSSAPAPDPAPQATPKTPENKPEPVMQRPPRASADQLSNTIMRVQAALMQRGYDPGAIDGELTPETSAALKRFQAENQLKANGRMTTETLTALGIKF